MTSIQIIDALTCFHVMLTSPPPLDYGVLNTFFGFRIPPPPPPPFCWDLITICYKRKAALKSDTSAFILMDLPH